MQCAFVSSFVARVLAVAMAALFFYLFTVRRILNGIDQRNITEFSLLFFNLGCQQLSGGILLAIFSVLHDNLNEPGYSPLIWYSVNFDFETVFTLTYLFLFKSSIETAFFAWASKIVDVNIRAGHVMGPVDKARIVWQAVVANFVFSVGIVGVAARVASMASIFLLGFIPLSPIYPMAYMYTCDHKLFHSNGGDTLH